MRALVLSACILAIACPVAAKATQGDRDAYQLVMKCYVANAFVSDDWEKAGDAAKAADYNTKARRSFDLAFVLGAKIGLTDAQVLRDIDFTQTNELPKLLRSADYQRQLAGTCKGAGLM